MGLLLHLSDLDNGVMLRCEGRLVCGPEAEALEQRVCRLLPLMRNVVLELSQVTFVDSGGLGLLVRLMTSARRAGGDVKLAAPSPQLTKLLDATCLKRAFDLYHSPEEALSSLGRNSILGEKGQRVLCVDPSCDVLSFVRTVLRHAGYSVLTTENLFDAKILMRASEPDLLVLGPNLDPVRARESLREYLPRNVLALDARFERLEAGDAKAILLEKISTAAA